MSADDERRQQARSALVAKFRAAALERLRRLNGACLEIERDPSALEAQQEALREIHTLKGEARLVGLAAVSEAAHKTEEVIFHARKSAFRVAAPVHDAILAGLDVMAALLKDEAEPAVLGEYARRADAAMAAPPAPEETMPPVAATTAPVSAEDDPSRGVARGGGHAGWISVDLGKVDGLTNVVGDLVQDQSRRERSLESLIEISQAWRDQVRLARIALQKAVTAFGDLEELTLIDSVLERETGLERDLRNLVARLRDDVFEEGLRASEAEARLRDLRMTPLSSLFSGYLRGARDLARELGKSVRVEVEGENVGADKRVLDQIAEPLLHLLRNAVDHGLEPPAERRRRGKPEEGRVVLRAHRAGGRLQVSVSDDGAGLDAEAIGRVAVAKSVMSPAERDSLSREQILETIFREGFSTRSEVSDVSGRGVGLDVVRRRIENLGGAVTVSSEPGTGTRFLLDVPLSLALVEVLLFTDGTATYALPTSSLDRVLTLAETVPRPAAGGTVFHVDSEIVPLGDLGAILGLPAPGSADDPDRARILVVVQRGRKLGVRVSAVLGYRSLVQREPDAFLEGIRLLSGTAILGDGRMVLVLDPAELLAASEVAVRAAPRPAAPPQERSILLVDDSEITRLLLAEIFLRLGYRVREAGDGQRGLEALTTETPDLILLDLDMPVMTGFQFLEKLRARPNAPHVPVIVFSSRGSDEDKRRSVALGADAYLVKSRFEEADLVHTVQRFLPGDGP